MLGDLAAASKASREAAGHLQHMKLRLIDAHTACVLKGAQLHLRPALHQQTHFTGQGLTQHNSVAFMLPHHQETRICFSYRGSWVALAADE